MQHRELKFRVWDIKSKIFRFPEDFAIKGNGELIQYLGMDNEDSSHPDDVFESVNNKNYTSQQFTGLKDKNGKNIYEGDILLYSLPYKEMMECGGENDIDEVVFIDGAFKIKTGDFLADLIIKENTLDEEIIGNIFETPELLENK